MTTFNPDLDLELIRFLKAPPAAIWRCWTDPALLRQWWAPKPVITREAIIDLRPGGRFFTMMILPSGDEHPTEGCFLAVQPERCLIFTDMLEAGFRPATTPIFGFTAIITMVPEGAGTRYTAQALHKTHEICQQHANMGFHEGWGAAASQLEALASTI